MPFSWLRRERFWRQLHFYLGLLLSLQLLAWFASGVVMSWFPIEQVRGEHLQSPAPTVRWSNAVISPAAALQQAPKAFQQAQLSLSQRGAEPVYQLQQDEQQLFISALSGQMLATLSANDVQTLAQQRYQGTGTVHSAELLPRAPAEVRGLKAPLWQVQFADAEHTAFYFHPVSGQLQRVRTDTWRLYDFFWMLHIMDYEDRSDFNHPLLIISAGSALGFTLGGFVLLGFRIARGTRRHKNVTG
ncbi:MAG: PepSY domain-containing protein [Rheinheimera sp.]|nr:PepSY domain-containing protein [Rheinheimera sp.]